MSLQGSLDAFALPDVLVLLAGTKKSGELSVSGHRADVAVDGRIWVDSGHLVGADVPRAMDVVDAVFELLRLTEGSFSFEPGEPPSPQAPLEVEPVLADAESRLIEWREIERVVPSLAAWLELSSEAPSDEVVIGAEQWRMIASIAGGSTVSDVVDRHGRGELPGCRAVKDLVETGLVRLGTAPASQPAWGTTSAGGWAASWGVDSTAIAAAPEPAAAERAADERAAAEPAAVYDEQASPAWSFSSHDTEREQPDAWPTSSERSPEPAWAGESTANRDAAWSGSTEHTAPDAAPVPDWRAELGDAQDLDAFVSLAERRREAADDGDPRPDAADAVEDSDDDADEPLNRGLLLKFLSSVRN